MRYLVEEENSDKLRWLENSPNPDMGLVDIVGTQYDLYPFGHLRAACLMSLGN